MGIIDSNIKSALKENNLKKLMQWLAVANQGVFNESCLTYHFADGESLVDYAFRHSKELLEHYKQLQIKQKKWNTATAKKYNQRYLLPAQSCTKLVFELLKDRKENPNPVIPTLSLYQRFIGYFSRQLGTIHFKGNPVTIEKASEKLKANLTPVEKLSQKQRQANKPSTGASLYTPSIGEQTIPIDLISDPDRLIKRMGKNNARYKQAEKSKDNTKIPAHLKQWMHPLSVVHEIDMAQAQQQQQTVSMNQAIRIESTQRQELQPVQDQQMYYDNSYLSYNTYPWNMYDRRTLHTWFELLKNAISAKQHDAHCDVYISHAALDILNQGEEGMKTLPRYRTDFDLENLPLGFFIELVKMPHPSKDYYVLKYSPALREDQLKLPDSVLKLDPASSTPQKKSEQKKAIPEVKADKNTLIQLLKNKQIELTTEQLDFLDKLNIAPQHSNAWIPGRIYSALEKIASITKPIYFSAFVDALMLLKNREFEFRDRYAVKSSPAKHNLLELFLNYYLQSLESGTEFNSLTKISALKNLAELDDEELRLFYLLSQSYEMFETSKPRCFAESWSALVYFTDFYHQKGFKLPEGTADHLNDSSPLLVKLRGLLECINLSCAPALQASYTHKMPRNLTFAAKALREGYSFVHESMCFDYTATGNPNRLRMAITASGRQWSLADRMTYLIEKDRLQVSQMAPDDLPLIINPDEFKAVTFSPRGEWFQDDISVIYRILYVRYIASQVAPEHIQTALAKWEEIIGENISNKLSREEREKNRQEQGTSEKPVLSHLEQQLAKHWETMKAYALSLPNKLSLVTDEKPQTIESQSPTALRVDEKQNALRSEHIYSLDDVQTLFNTMKLENRIQVELKHDIEAMNQKAAEFAALSAQELVKKCKSAKEALKQGTLSLADCLSLLRELHYRFTYSHSHEPKKGQWLRLEQAVAVLMAVKYKGLFQVDTSEGKTLIISLAAILNALQGKKLDVLTHNEFLAEKAADDLNKLAQMFDISVASKKDHPDVIKQADIYYVDAQTAVIDDKLAQFNTEEKTVLRGNRQADIAYLDELDNLTIDIQATTTMQISEENSAANVSLEPFLTALNHIIRNQLSTHKDITDKTEQRAFVRKQLDSENNESIKMYYQTDSDLDHWISAAVEAMNLIKKQDYVVEEHEVRIVHKKTTGRVDKVSHWGAGVHQCVSAYENSLGLGYVKIPPLTRVIAEGNIASYLASHYQSRCGFTGTFGDDAVLNQMKQVMQQDVAVVIPRAKRDVPPESAWPIVGVEKQPVYSRAYRYPPLQLGTREDHFSKLFEMISSAQQQEMSCIVFFNTISECDEFNAYLVEHDIGVGHIQIYDDTHDDESKENVQSLRPAEATAIERAQMKKMITLTTAAGSRGTDFDSVNIGILAKPSLLDRVVIQKISRIGRNGQLGVAYEVYCEEDFDETARLQLASSMAGTEVKAAEKGKVIDHDFRRVHDEMESRTQAADLSRIRSAEPLREFKDTVQREYAEHIQKNNVPASNEKKHDWASFFGKTKADANVDDLKKEWSELKSKHGIVSDDKKGMDSKK